MLETKVKEIIAKRLDLNAGDITLEMEFKSDLKVQSIELVELIMDFEEAFNIQVDDDAVAEVKTVGDIVAYLANVVK